MQVLSVGIIAFVLAGASSALNAQLPPKDQSCIGAFNKGVRKVVKAQGNIVKSCLKDFSNGKLVGSTPEDCVRSDPEGKLNRAVESATAKIAKKCSAGLPAVGTSPVDAAMIRSALSSIDLAHGAFGRDLDVGVIQDPTDSACQADIVSALVKCENRRLREYVKCQKAALRGGVTTAAGLAAACLGTGSGQQPDPRGLIALDCHARVAGEVAGCTSTDLAAAVEPCNTSDPNAATTCLEREAACQVCLLINDVDTLSRDCDLLDDGNTANGSCGRVCADGILQGDEGCDDTNINDNDGCSATCTVEGGWTCTGEPSVCTLNCGNGNIDPGELCDDDDLDDGDGCSSTCTVEDGYTCTGEPSVCTPDCGNGDIDLGEACDDGDASSGDGCSSTCQVEAGYNCSGEPSVCTFVCGNGSFQSGETCDDGDASSGDGCSNVCQIEAGWLCSGQPSLCTPLCGDGIKRGGELCDDGDTSSGDGCSFNCLVETGFACTGEPSNCAAVCGDGFIRGFENCDDSDTMSGDGCSGTLCRQESSFSCAGQPSVCTANCGDGNLDNPEECDDGDLTGGDGCNGSCVVEAGWACGGQPSVCAPTCGNSFLDASETCDDGNLVSKDGCSSSCRNESGWFCLVPGTPCQPFEIVIDSPAHGIFTTAASVVITGHYTVLPVGFAGVMVNGVPADVVNPLLRTFSHTVTLNGANVFNPVRATVTNITNGDDAHDRIVVIAGQSVADGAHSPQSVAMRINDSGLNTMEPLVAQLAGGQLNLATILPAGTTLINDECFITVIGCWGSASVRIANPPPSFSNFTLSMDSKTNVVEGDIDIFNLRVDVDIDGSGLVPDCGLRLTANILQLDGNYALQPLAGDPSNVDVNLSGPLNVSFSGFNHTFTSGLCDAPIIGDIIQAFLPDIEQATTDGIRGFLSDPDGGGPADSPIAAAIQTTLAGISISGPIGAGLGLMLDTPLFTVAEDNTGITFGSDSRFQVSVGNGPGQCIPPLGAPNFTASYSKPSVFPSFGANTPQGNQPYGLGICISAAGFNQLLRGQTECGLMISSMTSIDLDGPGGGPALPITSSLLSLIIPEFAQLPPGTPLRIDIKPTLAPIVTGDAGPGGELTELKVSHIAMEIVEPGPETVWMGGAVDTRLGMNLAFNGSGLGITLAPPLPGNVSIAILENPLGASEAQAETVLPALIAPLIPQLAGAISGFPLPEFFGLSLQGVEVSRNGQFLSLFANLAPAP